MQVSDGTAVLLRGALEAADVADAASRDAIRADFEHVVSQYARPIMVELPTHAEEGLDAPEHHSGDVVLKFGSQADAQRAFQALNGRRVGHTALQPILMAAGSA